MKINFYKIQLMEISTPAATACKKLLAIVSNIFSKNNHTGIFEEEALIQYKAGIADTPNVCCNNTLTTTRTNNISDDAKRRIIFIYTYSQPGSYWKPINFNTLTI